MRLLSTISCFLLVCFHPFEAEVKEATQFLKKEKTTVLQIKNTSATEGGEALSIVFPELIRWSAFKDYFETAAIELLYVEKGKETANFSVGYFQMKPSFIEQLENYIATHENLKTFDYVVLRNTDEKVNRKERVHRLKELAWQLRYAHVFWLVAQDVFKHPVFKNRQERVRFYATAYNYGFLRPEKEIEIRLTRTTFPFGPTYTLPQVAYGDLAVEFFDKYSKDFEK